MLTHQDYVYTHPITTTGPQHPLTNAMLPMTNTTKCCHHWDAATATAPTTPRLYRSQVRSSIQTGGDLASRRTPNGHSLLLAQSAFQLLACLS